MDSASHSGPSPKDIEEAETWVQVANWLDRLDVLVRAHGHDPDLLDALDWMRAENDLWQMDDEATDIARERLALLDL